MGDYVNKRAKKLRHILTGEKLRYFFKLVRQYWRFKGLRALPWTSARPVQRLHTASPISDITLNIFSIARRIFRGLQKGSFRLGGSRQVGPRPPRTRSQSVVLYSNEGVSFGSSLRE